MATYNLSRINILLVEDNTYVRNILEDLLRSFEVGRITTAVNGADAIEALKTAAAAGGAGSLGIDIIISDLVMSPINGLLLLRWTRSAKESPNRFMPFLMLSGAADQEYVRAARDLGVTEFLAKPFSAESVYKRLLELIDYPRQFVATQEYYGPDRRRQDMGLPPDTKDRRMTKDCDISVVYSSDRVVKPKKPSEVWNFRLPNSLKEKVGGLGQSGPGEIPVGLLEEAENQLERAQLDFTEWALGYLKNLSSLCEEAKGKEGGRGKYFEEINLLAHELRGQGGTFGYPLISMFGKMLFECTGEGCKETDAAVEIVKCHIDAMRAVLRDKVAGDGGETGRALLKHLKHAVAEQETVE